MSPTPYRLVIIVGSVRENRFGPTVAHWFTRIAKAREDVHVDVVDVADAMLPLRIGQPSPEVAKTLDTVTPLLEAADAFVVVTPEYNHSFPASLKSFVDWHYTQWRAKPIGFVSYGGLAGGLRSVEQLRLVFAELHAVTIRDTVSFHMAWDQFGPDGELEDSTGPDAAAKVMLDQLEWWADALRRARSARPYAA